MSSASPAARAASGGVSNHTVKHNFDGDASILNATFDSRLEIRKALEHLQKVLRKSEGGPSEVVADIKLRISGPEAREHTYTVSVKDDSFDTNGFFKQVPMARRDSVGTTSKLSAGSPVTSGLNGQRGPSAHATPRAETRANGDDDDVMEIRPPKRARIDADDSASHTLSANGTDGMLRETLALLKRNNSNDTLDFIKQWHGEWVKQGGWLFDILNKAERMAKDNSTLLQTRVAATQDTLGASINASSAATLAELANISKLIPWLEHCRKTGADKVQAREEKWRTSSATFHDQTRRDRESAEKRIEQELQRQKVILLKIAEANGVDVDDEDEKEEGRDEREVSLGAQLTAELNMEANRADAAKAGERKSLETINIEDDEDE